MFLTAETSLQLPKALISLKSVLTKVTVLQKGSDITSAAFPILAGRAEEACDFLLQNKKIHTFQDFF